MNEKEIKEAVQRLKEAGWEAMVCDTPVPYFDNGVPAGNPNNMGDYDGDFIMLPRGMVEYEPVVMIRVKGDSMCNAGLDNGDVVMVQLCSDVKDGEIVVVWLDGEATLKAFCHDENGEPWLFPQNEKYHPIRLKDFTDVWIIGKVVGVKKTVPSVPFRQMMQQLKSVKRESTESPSDDKLKKAIAKVAKQIEGNSRLWFSIYRVMVDKGMLSEGDFYGLRDKVNQLFPDNDFSINPRDLQKLDVGSFHKRLSFWDEHDAPVQGKRFYEYLAIANAFRDLLV